MNCAPELLEALLDNELDASQRAAVEQHLASCPACSTALSNLREQKQRIAAEALYYDAPPALRQSIHAALVEQASRPTNPEPPVGQASWPAKPDAPPARTALPWRTLALAASLLLAVSAGWNLLQWRSGADRSVSDAVLTAHVRSLIGDHLFDVASTDQHTVKPWFAGKLDFAPDVRDFAAEGFPLTGGRVDYLEGRRVAALVYRRRQHTINVFEWPGPPAAESRLTRDGYNIIHWTCAPMTCWATSDLSMEDLSTLRSLWN